MGGAYYIVSNDGGVNPEGALSVLSAAAAARGEGRAAWRPVCDEGEAGVQGERTLLEVQCFEDCVVVAGRQSGAAAVFVLEEREGEAEKARLRVVDAAALRGGGAGGAGSGERVAAEGALALGEGQWSLELCAAREQRCATPPAAP